jgi:acyl dehydratase
MGFPANVAVSYDVSFHRNLSIGERPRHFTTVVNISDKKTTSLGEGFFVTEKVEYLTQDEGLFAEALITFFQYVPARGSDGTGSPESTVEAGKKSKEETPIAANRSRQPDFEDLDVTGLKPGAQLPRLSIPITRRLIVAGAIATQDFIPVHHDVPAARAVGMPDIFMNILSTCGLSARYLGDWAGRGSRLLKIKFDLLTPNFPGDTLEMEGAISAVTLRGSGAEVVVSFGGKNNLGYHTRGSATLALPGKNSL